MPQENKPRSKSSAVTVCLTADVLLAVVMAEATVARLCQAPSDARVWIGSSRKLANFANEYGFQGAYASHAT